MVAESLRLLDHRFNNRNRPIEVWTGTSDTGWGDPSGGGDMVKVAETECDEGDPHGLGLVTKGALYPDGRTVTGTKRVTEYLYGSRRRLRVVLNPAAPHTVISYDAADRPVFRASYSSKTGLGLSTNPAAASAKRISLEKILYDERDRVYETTMTGVRSRRSVSSVNTIRTRRSSGRSKTATPPYTDGTNARVSVSSVWYDDSDRVTHTPVYGTVGSLPSFSRTTPPSSSAAVLVSETKYDDAGRVYESVDDEGTVTRVEFDDLGRSIAVIENYTGATPGITRTPNVRRATARRWTASTTSSAAWWSRVGSGCRTP